MVSDSTRFAWQENHKSDYTKKNAVDFWGRGKQASKNMADFSQMKITELIGFAEEQAQKEQDNPAPLDPDRGASWATTVTLLREIKARCAGSTCRLSSSRK